MRKLHLYFDLINLVKLHAAWESTRNLPDLSKQHVDSV